MELLCASFFAAGKAESARIPGSKESVRFGRRLFERVVGRGALCASVRRRFAASGGGSFVCVEQKACFRLRRVASEDRDGYRGTGVDWARA